MKWVLAQQGLNDVIRFYSNEEQTVKSMMYKDFLKYLAQFNIVNFQDLINMVNRFYTIFIDLDSGNWKLHLRHDEPATFNELVALNLDKAKITNLSEDVKQVDKRNVSKVFVNTIMNWKKSKFFGKGEKR